MLRVRDANYHDARTAISERGKVRERIATHIVTGAHGHETLCTSGNNISRNEEGMLIENCEKLAEGDLTITCPTCFVIRRDVHQFTAGNFDTESGKGNFADIGLNVITIGQLSELEAE